MKSPGKLLMLIMLGFLLLTFPGCANKTHPEKDDSHPEEEDRPGNSVKQVEAEWTLEIDGNLQRTHYGCEAENSSYMLVNNQMILRTKGSRANVISIDFETGEVLWNHELWEDGFDPAFIGFIDGNYYVSWMVNEGMLIHPIIDRSSSKLYLEKLGIANGELVWRQPVASFDETGGEDWFLKLVNELLIIRRTGFDSHMDITAVHSIHSGELLYSLQGRAIQHENSFHTISTDLDREPSSFRLANYDLSTGVKRWESTVIVGPVTDLLAWEAIDAGNTILFSLQFRDYQNRVIALNNTSGKLLWKRDGFRIYRPAYSWLTREVDSLEGDTVILTSENQVLLVDKDTGEKIKSLSIANYSSVAIHDGKVFLSDRDTLKALDLATTGLLWEKKVGGTISISNDHLFVSEEEKLTAFNIPTGSLLWENKLDEPRLLLRRPGVLWVSSDLFRAKKDPEGPRIEVLKALHPETGEEIASFDFSWWSNGGPGILPIRVVASDANSWKFDYLYYLKPTQADNVPERVYITLNISATDTKVLNADTGEELWNVENLRSHLVSEYNYFDLFLNVVYFYNNWFSGKREFLVLDKETGEIIQHFTSNGEPLTIIGNQLLLVQRGDETATLSSVILNN